MSFLSVCRKENVQHKGRQCFSLLRPCRLGLVLLSPDASPSCVLPQTWTSCENDSQFKNVKKDGGGYWSAFMNHVSY